MLKRIASHTLESDSQSIKHEARQLRVHNPVYDQQRFLINKNNSPNNKQNTDSLIKSRRRTKKARHISPTHLHSYTTQQCVKGLT